MLITIQHATQSAGIQRAPQQTSGGQTKAPKAARKRSAREPPSFLVIVPLTSVPPEITNESESIEIEESEAWQTKTMAKLVRPIKT